MNYRTRVKQKTRELVKWLQKEKVFMLMGTTSPKILVKDDGRLEHFIPVIGIDGEGIISSERAYEMLTEEAKEIIRREDEDLKMAAMGINSLVDIADKKLGGE